MKRNILKALFLFYFSFLVFSQSSENSPLYFGNPGPLNVSREEGFLIEKEEFTIFYNSIDLIPNWVAWHLSVSDLGEASRSNDFRPDSDLPEDFYAVKKQDYQYTKYGFDRGHVCPSADRTLSKEANSVTFLMTNMLPQCPDLNRIVWKDLESFERNLVLQGKEVYIFAGGAGKGGESQKGFFESIELLGKNGLPNGLTIRVPAYCWKIILILPEGENDLERISADTEIIAVYMPNKQGISSGAGWKDYLTSVDFIEESTGLDFFNHLPDDLEGLLEAKIYSSDK